MIKALIALLFALPLLSIAPAPQPPTVYWTRLAVQTGAQQCTWEVAPARLRQEIADPAGIPYGNVAAWSCSGDSVAVVAELAERAAAMHAEAAAYRAAHPLK